MDNINQKVGRAVAKWIEPTELSGMTDDLVKRDIVQGAGGFQGVQLFYLSPEKLAKSK